MHKGSSRLSLASETNLPEHCGKMSSPALKLEIARDLAHLDSSSEVLKCENYFRGNHFLKFKYESWMLLACGKTVPQCSLPELILHLQGQLHDIFGRLFFMSRPHMDPWVSPYISFKVGFELMDIFEFESCSPGVWYYAKIFLETPRNIPCGKLFQRALISPANIF